jgi:hypothetical protein
MWLILGPAAWVSWISPGMLRSICVDVAGLRLKDVAAWVSWISPGLLRSIFVVYCMLEILRSFRVSACGSHLVCG